MTLLTVLRDNNLKTLPRLIVRMYLLRSGKNNEREPRGRYSGDKPWKMCAYIFACVDRKERIKVHERRKILRTIDTKRYVSMADSLCASRKSSFICKSSSGDGRLTLRSFFVNDGEICLYQASEATVLKMFLYTH